MKRIKILMVSVVCLITILSVTKVIVANTLSTTGLNLSEMEQQIAAYKKENALLKEKLLSISSLTYIASKASNSGFIEEKTRVFVGTTLPLAVKQ